MLFGERKIVKRTSQVFGIEVVFQILGGFRE